MAYLLLSAAIGAGIITTYEYVAGNHDDAQCLLALTVAIGFAAGAFR